MAGNNGYQMPGGFFSGPPICGGTNKSYDNDAPQVITSDDMVKFSISSAFTTMASAHSYDHISLFACKMLEGSFASFTATDRWGRQEKLCGRYCFTENIMPLLLEIPQKYNMANRNGYHSYTSGLPENFGGSVNIDYSNGEFISKSDNQSPVVPFDAAYEALQILQNAKNTVPLRQVPDVSEIVSVKYIEECHFKQTDRRMRMTDSRKELTLIRESDKCRYFSDMTFGEQNFKQEKELPPDAFGKIDEMAERSLLLVWNLFRAHEWKDSDFSHCFLTFTLRDGSEVSFSSAVDNPSGLYSPFSEISLYFSSLSNS